MFIGGKFIPQLRALFCCGLSEGGSLSFGVFDSRRDVIPTYPEKGPGGRGGKRADTQK